MLNIKDAKNNLTLIYILRRFIDTISSIFIIILAIYILNELITKGGFGLFDYINYFLGISSLSAINILSHYNTNILKRKILKLQKEKKVEVSRIYNNQSPIVDRDRDILNERAFMTNYENDIPKVLKRKR